MQFQLEVYTGDDHLGTVVLHNRYAQAVIGGETYPFRSAEDACVALYMAQQIALANEEKNKH